MAKKEDAASIADKEAHSGSESGLVNMEDDQYRSQPKEKVSMATYVRIFSYASKVDFILLTAGSLAAIGAGITLPLMNIVFGRLLSDFNGYSTPGSSQSQDQLTQGVDHNSLLIVYLWIAKFSLCYITMFSFRIAGIRISAALRLAYLKAIFSQPISVTDKLPPGQAASVITSSANIIQIGISEKLSSFLQSAALLVSAFAVAFTYSWQLTLATSSSLLFILLVYGITVPIFLKLQKRMEQADEKAASIASEVFNSIRMIVACGAELKMAAKYKGWVEESRKRGLRISPVTGFQLSPMFFSVFATFALSFWFGIKLYQQGNIASVQAVIVVLFSVMMVTFAIGGLAGPISDVSKATSAATGFFTMIDSAMPLTAGLKEPDVTASNDIVFESINFAYPSRPKTKVLDNLNVRFEAGKLTAIVGPSGSGKSTIVALLERWYSIIPQASADNVKALSSEGIVSTDSQVSDIVDDVTISGSINIGGTSLNEIDMKWWRSQIGLVQQEPFIFNDTIYKNVAYGLIGSKWEKEDDKTKRELVIEACKESFADEFISRLPEGYETQVGDSGIKLSGGQRQRLAIARSIIKRPVLLILDEATSSIDVRSERIVQDALDRVSKGRTTITIAHRLSTIKKADKIVVFRNGKVVEEGSHDNLMADENGVYYSMASAQQLRMGETETERNGATIWSAQHADAEQEKVKDILDAEQDPTKVVYKPKGVIGSLGLLLYEQRSHWLLYSFILAGAMGCGASYPIQAYLLAKIITVFQYFGQELTDGSRFWALMFFMLAIFVAITYYIMGWSCNALATHVSCNYRQQYFESILHKRIEFYDAEENSMGTLTSRVAGDPTQLQQMLGLNMALLYIAVFNLLGSIILAFYFGWKLTLVTVFAAMPVILTAGVYRIRFELVFEKMNAAVFAESSQFASESIGAFRTVTALTLEDFICDRYATLLQDHVRKAFLKARFSTLVFATSDSVNMLCTALTFWYGGKLLSSREYDAVQFLVIYTAIINGSEAAGLWGGFGPNLAQASAAANRILSFRLDRDSTSKSAVVAVQENRGGAKLCFEDVHFQYPTREMPIFAGLNLTIENGQFVAIVGASGSGKSTIVSLLERFYDVQKGRISYEGVDIKDLDIRDYRKSISLVAQEPTLFQGTIRENLLLAVEDDTPTEAIYQACRDAEIHDFIMSLPEGYSTDVGSRGTALSGGQKQRIAIARALIRQPRILLLDEATSSLDSESERLVQAALERARRGRTMVVVAHRLATVQNADVIFVLSDGKLLERGGHEDLVRQRGAYWQMCQSQALDR